MCKTNVRLTMLTILYLTKEHKEVKNIPLIIARFLYLMTKYIYNFVCILRIKKVSMQLSSVLWNYRRGGTMGAGSPPPNFFYFIYVYLYIK